LGSEYQFLVIYVHLLKLADELLMDWFEFKTYLSEFRLLRYK
jgi:hypothetical protein